MIRGLRTFKNWETWLKCFLVALFGWWMNDTQRTHFKDWQAFVTIFCIMVYGMYYAQLHEDQLAR